MGYDRLVTVTIELVSDFFLMYFSAVLPIPFLINMLIALKGSQFFFCFVFFYLQENWGKMWPIVMQH